MEHWRRIPNCLSSDRCAQLEALIGAQAHHLVTVAAPFNLGPRYRTLGGEEVQRYLPEVAQFGDTHVLPLVEAFAGRPIRSCANRGRAVRVQVFDDPAHEFRWHYDSGTFAALLTLRNTNSTETQIVPAAWSRGVRPIYYPLWWLPNLFSLLPRVALALHAGDLLILRGSQVLHRGVVTAPAGDRLLLVFAYDDVNRRATPWRDRITKYLNTGDARRLSQ